MVLNEQQRQTGRENFSDAARISRRQFLAGTAVAPTAYGLYWGYEKIGGDPVRVGLIGTGNQGCHAHISQSNPDFIHIAAICEIRPSNQARARKLLNEKYGDQARSVKLYTDYRKMLEDPNIEMIIVALPLHLHAKVTIDALNARKHVLCEKLMAKTVTECKAMVRAADDAKLLLGIGHQRHYSYLYAHAMSIIKQGVLGDVRYIRAYWHRNQTERDSWRPDIPAQDEEFYTGKAHLLKEHGYDSIEQLIRWRIDERTGGGLMVELGSHQLDAASIFLNHAHPVAVLGSGVLSYFEDSRSIDDHIFLNFEFGEDVHRTVVTYSSISTNKFDGYGEQVMGSEATLVTEFERDGYVFREGPKSKDTRIKWAESRMSRPTTDSAATTQWGTDAEDVDTITSRGYREEQEHMAWLIRNPDKIKLPSRSNPKPDLRFCPRCHGRVALADGVVALTANLAMRAQQRIEFKDTWFDPYSDAAPEHQYNTV